MAEVSGDPRLCFQPMDELLNVQVSDIVNAEEQVPILFRITDSISYLLDTLGANKILSAPVLDIDEKVVLGFVDYIDIANYLVHHLGKDANEKLTKAQEKELLDRSIRHASLLEFEKRDPFIIVLAKHPAALLVKGFNSGIHRIVFYNDETKISGICSQSDVLNFVAKQINKAEKNNALDQFLLCPIEKLGWGDRPVLSVLETATVIQCLNTMRSSQVSTVAVLDQHGKLVANFSASDLRGVSSSFITFLHMEVREFLALKSTKSLNPCTVKKETTVQDVITTLSESRMHHIWVSDEEGRATGVITLTDVMAALYSFDPKPPVLALSTPGFLEVQIVRARHLKSGWFSCHPYVVVRFPDRPRSTFQSAVSTSSDPTWEGQKFRIPISQRNYRDRVLFVIKDKHMIGKDDDLGYYIMRIDWVLNGFGSGNPMCTSTSDWVDLQSKDVSETAQGQLELRLNYKLL